MEVSGKNCTSLAELERRILQKFKLADLASFSEFHELIARHCLLIIFYNCDKLTLNDPDGLRSFALELLNSTNLTVKFVFTLTKPFLFNDTRADHSVGFPVLTVDQAKSVFHQMAGNDSLLPAEDQTFELLQSNLTFIKVHEIFYLLKSGGSVADVRESLQPSVSSYHSH
mmetsp:Transcript_4746/g.7163  ORF Transcript_4746/g.7163 Transcript_4746/m.7163 type:complete len:170 (+) Transcript_4746:172-681(+)